MRVVKFDIYSNNRAVIQTDLVPILREKLSVIDKQAKFISKRIGRSVSPRKYVISPTGRFEVGMFKTITSLIDTMDVPVRYEYSKSFIRACMPKIECFKEPLEPLNLDPYEYQEIVVRQMMKYGRGTVLIGTGGGKTFIMSLFANTVMKYNKNKRFLIIVPTIQLVEQTYNDFLDYGFDGKFLSKWSGSNPFNNTQIIVASSSILLSKKSDLSFLSGIDILMVDEVHGLKKDNEINKVVKKIQSPNKFGFTGTMPEETIDQWNVLGTIGPILFTKDSSELRNEKFITEAKINIIKINYNMTSLTNLHTILSENPNKYVAELEFIMDHEYRNDLICKISSTIKGNSLIMVDRILHGELLFDKLTELNSGNKIFFIQGEVGVDDRERIREMMEVDDDIICIAISKIFSTGINIKNIHNIVFATPGKAKVKLIQSIGRGLRLHENKSLLNVFDFADNLHYSNKHLRKREKLYSTEKLNYEIRNIREGH